MTLERSGSETGQSMGLRRASVALSGLSFVLGLILQPALGQLLDGTLNDPDKFLVAVGLTIIIALLLSGSALIWREEANQIRINSLETAIQRWGETTALTVEFISRGKGGSASDPYAIVIDMVEKANREILILDHRVPKDAARFGPDIDLKRPERKPYYEALDRAVRGRRNGGRIRYRRVVQLDDGPTKVWNSAINADEVFATHCRTVISERQTDVQTPSAIKTSKVFVPNATIVVVDQKYVLLEVAIRGADGATSVQGDLIFRDNEGVLAVPLRQLFENIDSQSTLIEEVD